MAELWPPRRRWLTERGSGAHLLSTVERGTNYVINSVRKLVLFGERRLGMTQNVLLKQKLEYSLGGVSVKAETGMPHFSASEIASLKQQLSTCSNQALE